MMAASAPPGTGSSDDAVLGGDTFADALAHTLAPGDTDVHAMVAAFGAPRAGPGDGGVPPTPFVDARQLTQRGVLGCGSAASVTLCTVGGGAEAPVVAVKRLHAEGRRSHAMRTSLAVEAAALRALHDAQSVVGFVGVALEQHAPRADGGDEETSLLLAMEAWGGGDTLRSKILKCMSGSRCFCGADAARWAAQSARAIADMHERGVAHRDVKPANLVLGVPRGADAKNKNLRVKLCDLGLARCLPRATTGAAASSVARHADATWSAHADLPVMDGTHPYIARDAAGGGSYDAAAADVFALGVTLYELFAMELLGAARVDVADKNFLDPWLRADDPWRPRLPADIPAPVAAVIRSCWSASPSERPSADEAARALETFAASVEAGEFEFQGYLAEQPPSWLAAAASAALASLTSSESWSYLVSSCGLERCLPAGAASSTAGAGSSMRSSYASFIDEPEANGTAGAGMAEASSDSECELEPLSPHGGMTRGPTNSGVGL